MPAEVVPAGRQETFYEVLTAAVRDLLTNGYDDPERVAGWQRRLQAAGVRSWGSEARLQEELRRGLRSTFERLVEQDGLLKWHGSIDRFTLANIKPVLRGELDRRLLAATDLIRLNRQEAVARMGRRWVGWATSIPKGGPAETDKRRLKEEIKKPLARLPFEERRLLIDQGHKLVAAVNATVATDGGAIGAKWRHVHQVGYDARPEHLERDGVIYLIRGSWAHERGLVSGSADQFTDSFEQPGELPFCRCGYVYLYRLRQLPEAFLTAAGRAALDRARELAA